ncbi:sodium/hydrogen exchanger family/TrkA domain protein [Nitrospira sp.]|nr:sodium/hydrogen exchanger family/TrkA domain protein [Nitrospira sp.]
MPEHGILNDLLTIFVISITIVFVFHQLRLPSIAGFLCAGAMIGPHGLNLVSDQEQVKVLAEIGVVLLLFTIGIEFSLAHMTAMRRLLLVGGLLQVGGVVLIVTLIGSLFGLSWGQSIFWGCLLSLSSTAIVLKALTDRGEMDSLHGRATTSILVFQDLAVVPMMLLVPLLAGPAESAVKGLAVTMAKAVLAVGLILIAARYLVPKFLERIVQSRTRELFVLTIIVLCLGIAWLTSLSGLSLALGAFIAGLVISESEYSHQAMAEVLPFRDSFNSLFFVSIGMLMDVRTIVEHPALVLGLIVAVLLVKGFTGIGAVLGLRQPPRAAVMTGIGLAQVGEFSFILAGEGQRAGLLPDHEYQVFLAVSVWTMLLTPFLIQWAPHLARRVEAWQRLHHYLPDRTTAHVLVGTESQIRIRDHVVIMGYGLNGRNLARVLGETEIPYVALDLDGDTVRREARSGIQIYYGDGTNPNVLRHVRIHDARVFVVAISDPFSARRAVQIARSLNPKIHIVVRTRYLRELSELHDLGADDVVPEEFETSIEIFTLVLRTFNLPQDFVMKKAEQVRREGYALLRRSEMPELAHHLRAGTLTDVEVETFRIDDDSPALGKSLADLALRQTTGASVIALTRRGETESNPSARQALAVGDILTVLGSRQQIRRALSVLVATRPDV